MSLRPQARHAVEPGRRGGGCAGATSAGARQASEGPGPRWRQPEPGAPGAGEAVSCPAACLVPYPRQRGHGGQALSWGPTAMRREGPGPEPQQDCGSFWVRGFPAWCQHSLLTPDQSHAQPPPRVHMLASSSGPSPAWTDPDPSCGPRPPAPRPHSLLPMTHIRRVQLGQPWAQEASPAGLGWAVFPISPPFPGLFCSIFSESAALGGVGSCSGHSL